MSTAGTSTPKGLRSLPSWFWPALAASVLPAILLPLNEKQTVSSHGSTWAASALEFPLGFALLGALLALVACPIVIFFGKQRLKAGAILVLSLVVLSATFIGSRLAGSIRREAFVALAERSKPLIAAIHRYETAYGTAPKSLDALVPDFLPAVPGTGINAYPEFELVTDPREFEENPWVVQVYTPSGFPNFDRFFYFPKQNYPETGYGGVLERLGDWAYVHE